MTWLNIAGRHADVVLVADVQYRSMMNSSDALIWEIEADPHLRSTVMAVWQLDSVPAPDRMRANVERMVAAIPRLRQRVEPGRPRPSWVETTLDVSRHYVEDRLPEGSTFDDAVAYAEQWVAEPFDRRAPLWRLGLLTGLEGGRAAAIIKVHHAIADGLGMVMMLAAFTDLERHPAPRPVSAPAAEPARDRPAWSAGRRVSFRVRHALTTWSRHPLRSTVDGSKALRSSIRLVTPNRTPCSTAMVVRSGRLQLDTRSIDLADVKATGRRHGGTVNDVFVTVVTDAVRRYHWRNGTRCEQLRVHMPVNSRNARTADVAGNEWVPARVVLRLGDGRDAVGTIRAQLDRLRAEPSLHHIGAVSAAVQRLGSSASRWIIGGMMKGVDVLASNVPGPPFRLFLAGAEVERFVAFGPPAGAALNVTAFSYDGGLHLGVTSDAASVTDRELFLDCLDESIALLVDRSPALVTV